MKLTDLGQLVATRAVADLQESNKEFNHDSVSGRVLV